MHLHDYSYYLSRTILCCCFMPCLITDVIVDTIIIIIRLRIWIITLGLMVFVWFSSSTNLSTIVVELHFHRLIVDDTCCFNATISVGDSDSEKMMMMTDQE